MKANELRIGNYIYSLETQNFQRITGVTEEHPFFDSITFDYPNYDEIESIPLTEEWILKFGFVYNGWNYYFGKYVFHAQGKKDNNEFLNTEFGIRKENKIIVISYHINFVHQLQNLYFALTGAELTFAKLLISTSTVIN